ncbi:uncharacterized protein LOC142591380 [Dermacentor variabilis]|uniref:uncharacterized protein LOC142591380 n=1 Tax=Dermacentor variabilis TaxID=34621 RepID=UPI003F5BDB93
MATAGNDTEAALAPHGANEVSYQLVDLEGATGCFSGNVIDYRMPCTATEDTACQIVPHLPVWNEILCWLDLELRELSETGGQLGLVDFPMTHAVSWKSDDKLQQAVTLFSSSYVPPESLKWWPALSQSLRQNRSIIDLGIGVDAGSCEDVMHVADAIIQSATIRKICLLRWSSPTLPYFTRHLGAGIFKNRTLCSATSSRLYVPWDSDWAADWFAVRNTARRNSTFVARAAQFLKHARCDRLCAAGLDRVSRHAALVAELAQVLSVDEPEADDMVRQHFRCIEGLHDFMRLAGVVKEQVTCLPRQDGRMQLDGLNEDCWARVRRHLELDDLA